MNKIREAMQLSGVTPKKMAELLGIKENTLSGYVTGKHDPKSENLVKIAKITGVTVDFLLGISEHPALNWNESENLPVQPEWVIESDQLADLYHYFISLDTSGREALLAAAKGMSDAQQTKNEESVVEKDVS